MSNENLTKEFLAERDARIFAMRKGGTSISEIAKRFNISSKAVAAAIQRQLERMNKEALLAYPELLRLELERLDTLQQALWPLTQHRKVRGEDGSDHSIEPDVKAVQQVLSIMDRRTKLLGISGMSQNDYADSTPLRAVLADAADRPAAVDEFDPETEAKRLIELMGQAGVLPAEQIDALLRGAIGTGSGAREIGPGMEYDADIVSIDEEDFDEEEG